MLTKLLVAVAVAIAFAMPAIGASPPSLHSTDQLNALVLDLDTSFLTVDRSAPPSGALPSKLDAMDAKVNSMTATEQRSQRTRDARADYWCSERGHRYHLLL